MTTQCTQGTANASPLLDAIRTAVAALNARDPDGYASAFRSDCTRSVPGLSDPLPMSDVMAGLEMFTAAFDGFQLEEVLLFGQGRYVCAHWRMTGIHTGDYLGIAPTGRRIAFETAEIYEFERDDGGLVRASWSFADPNAWLGQLRSIP